MRYCVTLIQGESEVAVHCYASSPQAACDKALIIMAEYGSAPVDFVACEDVGGFARHDAQGAPIVSDAFLRRLEVRDE